MPYLRYVLENIRGPFRCTDWHVFFCFFFCYLYAFSYTSFSLPLLAVAQLFYSKHMFIMNNEFHGTSAQGRSYHAEEIFMQLYIWKSQLNGQMRYKKSTSSKGLLSELGGFSKKKKKKKKKKCRCRKCLLCIQQKQIEGRFLTCRLIATEAMWLTCKRLALYHKVCSLNSVMPHHIKFWFEIF